MSTNGMGRVTVGVVAVAALALVGCGGSEGGGDTEAFCAQIRAIDAADETADGDIAAAADQFDALIDDAPDEIADDLRVVVDAFAELDQIDEDDPAAFELFFEIFERPEFIASVERLEQYGVDECGLEPAVGAGAPDEVTSGADDVIGVDTESVGTDTADGIGD